jgi:hypothetical protein
MSTARIQKISTFILIAALTTVCLSKTDTSSPQAPPSTPSDQNTTNFSDTLSDILGYLIVIFLPLSRLIQIKKCYDLKSTVGISFTSTLLEYLVFVFCFGYSYHYGYPFSSYGEYVPLITGSAVVLAQVWLYDGASNFRTEEQNGKLSNEKFQITFLGMALVLAGYLMDVFPDVVCGLAMNFCIFLFAWGKISQCLLIWKNRSTGALALVPIMFNLLGNTVRSGTAWVKTGDIRLVLNGLFGILMNGLLVAMFFVFWDKKPEVEEKKEK